MADEHRAVRELVQGGAVLHRLEWLDDQGRAAGAIRTRSMLRLTYRTAKGGTASERVPIEDVPQLADLLPAWVSA